MDTIPPDAPRKQCLTCRQWLPATTQYFHSHKHGRYGLYEHCKICRNTSRRKFPRVEEGHKRCTRCKDVKPATPEYFYEQGKGKLHSSCKQCLPRKQPPEVRPGQKQCFACKEWFPATSQFFQCDRAMKDGLISWCKPCAHEKVRLREERVKEMSPLLLTCTKCGKEKRTHDEFPKRSDNRYGIGTICKVCTNLSHKRIMQKPEQRQKQAVRVHRHYEEHKKEIQQRHRVWSLTNPDKVIALAHKRRALKRSAPGTYTAEQIQEQLKRQKYRCYYAACGFSKFKKENGKYSYHVDHTIPLSRTEAGPRNDIGSLVLACPSCNQKKFKKLPHEFFEGGRLL